MRLKIPEVLAFEKKICNSDGLMFSGSWNNRAEWDPIKLQHKEIRCTFSNRPKKHKSDLKFDAEVEKVNLQSVDVAAIPFRNDTLKLVFTLRVLGDISNPVACNKQDYRAALNEKIGVYLTDQKCREISLRYAENLANARFLWRNRLSSDAIEVNVSLIEKGCLINEWRFDALQYSLREFMGENDPKIKSLAIEIQKGLLGQSPVFLKIEAYARIGEGQEVFPSQELVLNGGNEKNKKSKILYSVDDVAAMHSQKIGNAIRTIDTWYPKSDEFGPISVEPYGSVTSRGEAFRKPLPKMDFYSLLDGWILDDKIPSLEQQHYVVACLVRGGVYGGKSETE